MNNIELIQGIRDIIISHYKSKNIKNIIDKGVWYKHIFKVLFDDNSCVYVKLKIKDGSNIQMEKNIIDLLNKNNIQQPEISFIDLSKEIIPYEYGIYEDAEGIALSSYINNSNKYNLREIYYSLGEYFSKYAKINSTFAGIWYTEPDKQKYPIHPIDAMYNFEIETGSTKELFQKNIISKSEYNKIKGIWYEFIPKIKDLPVHLTHFSPFPWCIYLDKKNNEFNISKVTALGDILWWNEHATVAHILYPPFYQIDDDLRKSFIDGYRRNLSNEIIYFFKLFYRLCAINGTYMHPSSVDSEKFELIVKDDIKNLIEILH